MSDSAPSLKPREEGLAQVPSPCSPVWLLDDDASMLKALGRLMNSAGVEVEKFCHPKAFLSKLDSAHCDVAVLDVWMPDMNGLEVQACLRQHSPETRIIFVSGRDDPSVRQTALTAGAFGFLAKPFGDEDLVDLVRQALTVSGHS